MSENYTLFLNISAGAGVILEFKLKHPQEILQTYPILKNSLSCRSNERCLHSVNRALACNSLLHMLLQQISDPVWPRSENLSNDVTYVTWHNK